MLYVLSGEFFESFLKKILKCNRTWTIILNVGDKEVADKRFKTSS